MRLFTFTLLLSYSATISAWLPPSGTKLRGVNLGSQFIIEPWMVPDEWKTMGCNGTDSDFDCTAALGQEKANLVFQAHWARWHTEKDMDLMASFGLNTIRIPVGFWIKEDLVNATETFPQGGLKYLEKACRWAAERGFYVIIDLHGAPGAQTRWQAFTGMWVPYPNFYTPYNYGRAYDFLAWMTKIIHTNPSFRTVGMLEVVNEPEWDFVTTRSVFYPNALSSIRTIEGSLHIPEHQKLHVQFMDTKWGAGDPNQYLPSGKAKDRNLAYDDHRYLKSDLTVPANKVAYMNATCKDNLPVKGETPLVVGEWSLGPRTAAENQPEFAVVGEDGEKNKVFYTQWWAAQVRAFEKGAGWAFWSWKAQLNGGKDWRWGYLDAVNAGIIPRRVEDAWRIGGC